MLSTIFLVYSYYNFKLPTYILLYFLNTLYYIIFLYINSTYIFDKYYIFYKKIALGENFLSPTLNIIQPYYTANIIQSNKASNYSRLEYLNKFHARPYTPLFYMDSGDYISEKSIFFQKIISKY